MKTNIFLNLIYVKRQPKKFQQKKFWVIQFIMNGHHMSRTLHEANGPMAFVFDAAEVLSHEKSIRRIVEIFQTLFSIFFETQLCKTQTLSQKTRSHSEGRLHFDSGAISSQTMLMSFRTWSLRFVLKYPSNFLQTTDTLQKKYEKTARLKNSSGAAGAPA